MRFTCACLIFLITAATPICGFFTHAASHRGQQRRPVCSSPVSQPGEIETDATGSGINTTNNINIHKSLLDDDDRCTPRFEDRYRDELGWLVSATGKLIGESALPIGKLNKSMVQQTLRSMRAWSQLSSKRRGAPHVVEQLLHRLIQEQGRGNPHVVIDTRTYNIVIGAWSKSREEGAAKRAEDILLAMEKQYGEGNPCVKPNRTSFNNVIKSWVRNGTKQQAVEKTEALINYMAELHHRDPQVFDAPCRRGYNLLLYAYAHSGLSDAGERASAVLDEMERSGKTDPWISPDSNTYNLVIKTWGQGKAEGFESRATAVFDRVLELYRTSPEVTPNQETFNAILSCCLKSKQAAATNRIMDYLDIMESMFHEGNVDAKPDEITLNLVMTALARGGELEQMVQLQNRMEEMYGILPNTLSSNILIDGWSKSRRPNAADQALEILTRMEEDFKKGNVQILPDNYSYTSVIDCFVKSKSPHAGRQAMNLLDRMQALHREHGGAMPSTDCYNAALNSLACARNKDSADQALSILAEMEETSDSAASTVPKPNRVTYNTCLKACRNGLNEYAARAEELFARMVQFGEEDASLAPDSYSYAAVINVLGHSDLLDKSERVLLVMKQMISSLKAGKKASKPSIHVFNAALNACAFTRYDINSKLDAFVIVVSILILLQEYTTPDAVTYGTVLRACSNLLPRSDPRRDELVTKVFRKASKEGHVDGMVLTQLKFAASTPLFRELVGIDSDLNITLDDLPRSWCKKVKGRNARWGSTL